ncbi:helix-turn-helix domain-containing protein [Brucella sp. 21LCYQ03]|nr:helix-turn-helix domain-containing protein [Brucella sp. 21LCYQ03]
MVSHGGNWTSNCYSQITLPERRRLFELRQREVPLGDIARLMGRHRSTIYREIKRNSFRDTEIPDCNGYHSVVGHRYVNLRVNVTHSLTHFLCRFQASDFTPHVVGGLSQRTMISCVEMVAGK